MACQFPEGAVIRHVFGNVTVDFRVIVVPPSHTTFFDSTTQCGFECVRGDLRIFNVDRA
jgi:hypothetical protein